MYDAKIVSSRYDSFYKVLLLFYPKQYRKRFGQEMLIVFRNLYHEELAKHGKVGITFWISIFADTTESIIIQHIDLMRKQGIRKYMHRTLHINKYNIISGILLLPFFSLFIIDLVSRILQGDLIHYNRPVYAYLSHTPLYWFPVLYSIAILFPTLSILITIIPLIRNSIKSHNALFRFAFVKQNAISLLLLFVGLGFLAIIKFHDFAPCMIHGLLKIGIGQLPKIISVCRNA